MISLPPKKFIASFDVDAQNTFTPLCPDELPVEGGHEIVDELNRQATFASIRIGSKDAHSAEAIWIAREAHLQFTLIEGENVDMRWVKHAVPGTKGFELLSGLPKITEYDFFVWKGIELDMHPYGSCYHDFAEKMSTGVIEFLRSREIKTVLVGGLATDYCVKNTVLQLLKANFQVIVNLAAIRGVAKETTEQAIEQMNAAGAILIKNISELEHT